MTKFFLENELWFWYLIIFITVGDLVIPHLLAPFYEGYSHKNMVMSSLGNPQSPVRIYYNIWLFISGLLLSLFSVFFYIKYNSFSVTLLLLVFSFGAMILSSLFSVNETKEIVTLSSNIHGYGSAFGFIALLFLPLVLAISSQKYNVKYLFIVAVICFILALIFFILFIMSDKDNFNDTVINFEGIWQRLTLLFMYMPLIYIAIFNLRE